MATITLLGVEGKVYSPSNISFFPSPNGMTTDNAGYVYVTCYSANKVFKYGPIPATGNVSLSPSAVFTIPLKDRFLKLRKPHRTAWPDGAMA